MQVARRKAHLNLLSNAQEDEDENHEMPDPAR